MAVGCIVSLMDGTADLGVSIAVMSVLIIICLFFGVVSVVGVIIFAVTNKKNKKIKKYLNVIAVEKKLEAIATAMGKDYETVKIDVRDIIEHGHLGNAYLNEGTGEIIITGSDNKKAPKTSVENNTPKEGRAIACPSCGANNTIFGDVGECEFCGSPIK